MTKKETVKKMVKHMKCNHDIVYSEKYDANYCDKCKRWLEDCCSDPDCEFCKYRPATAHLEGK